MSAIWSVTTLEYLNDSTKGVTAVHWRCSDMETVETDGVSQEHHGLSYGRCFFVPDTSDSKYTDFDDLTEADVLSWVYTLVDRSEVEASTQLQIDESKQPKLMSGKPW